MFGRFEVFATVLIVIAVVCISTNSAQAVPLIWGEDCNGNGWNDRWFWDLDGDGNPEIAAISVIEPFNGTYKHAYWDTDDAGYWERYAFDVDGDGDWDEGWYDLNYDQYYEWYWLDADDDNWAYGNTEFSVLDPPWPVLFSPRPGECGVQHYCSNPVAAIGGNPPPDCPVNPPSLASVSVPAVSEWGLVVMAMLVLTAATVVIMRRRTIVHG